ncbi:bis(monoacylglycero)phosphate synthase CLN5-like [Haliotis cracherodii]|uniref:bis(monoacylglycero)phosphate synthase CLN5-like n=1 Tax=Haliotis cracherodii TaxID=6455 RepID=UPI0039E7C99B
MSSNLFIILTIIFCLSCVLSQQHKWPVEHRRVPHRPPTDPRCQTPNPPFCVNGISMPTFSDDDRVELFHMYADLTPNMYLPDFPKHVAIGFWNVNTNTNYTIDWYGVYLISQCSLASVLTDDSLLWCNQGAVCVTDGIKDKFLPENKGQMSPMATMTGSQFNQYTDWIEHENDTNVECGGSNVLDTAGSTFWFRSNDCGSFINRSYQALSDIGVTFNTGAKADYTMMVSHGPEPTYLGQSSVIFGSGRDDPLAKNITNFYRQFNNTFGGLNSAKNNFIAQKYAATHGGLYVYMNSEYWFAPLVEPYLSIVQLTIDLP